MRKVLHLFIAMLYIRLVPDIAFAITGTMFLDNLINIFSGDGR